MRLSDGILVVLFLVLAFGGEVLVLWLTPRGSHNVIEGGLPYGVFFLGLGLAFWAARRGHQRETGGAREAGTYCEKCGYNLRETPERCPECGGVGTGKVFAPISKRDAKAHAIMTFILMTLVALLAAAAIMIHVQILNISMSGGH